MHSLSCKTGSNDKTKGNGTERSSIEEGERERDEARIEQLQQKEKHP